MNGYDPAATGCTAPGCGTQQTSTLDGIHGRRCADHPPTFSRRWYDECVRNRLGVTAYVRTALERLRGEAA